jgi:hypothetical protein
MIIDLVTSLALIAIGFLPTLGAMEAAWRMGKSIDKRADKKAVWRSA